MTTTVARLEELLKYRPPLSVDYALEFARNWVHLERSAGSLEHRDVTLGILVDFLTDLYDDDYRLGLPPKQQEIYLRCGA